MEGQRGELGLRGEEKAFGDLEAVEWSSAAAAAAASLHGLEIGRAHV